MPPAVPDSSIANTPLAPSVEKAYYRKCIELKRRLNEVETANDEAKVRRIRLDRAIMKMRLERAFLLEQLSKRMEIDVDGSEGSEDEQVNTPPPDRPHRDKKRKTPGEGGAPSSAARPSDVATKQSPPISPINSARHSNNGRAAEELDTNGTTRMDVDRGAGVAGESVGAGPTVFEDANGQQRTAPEDRVRP